MQITRRQWLSSVAALPSLAVAKPAYRPRIGVALYVWTQQFAREKKTLAQGMEEAFPAIARAGYSRVELMSQFWAPDLRERTKALLAKYKIVAVSVYNGGLAHTTEGAEKTIAQTLEFAEIARSAGARTVSFNANPTREPKTDGELAIQAKALNELGARLRDRKMQLLIHQHAPEMRDNAREWRHILRNTDPKLVRFCLDLDWVKRGGQDPMALLKEAGPRLGSLHVRSARQGVWMEEFGDGDLDYREIAAHLRRTGFSGDVFIELAWEKATAITRPLEENLKRSRVYAERVFL
jgi:inosose dehydratase